MVVVVWNPASINQWPPPDDVQLRIAKEELIWDAFAGQCLVFSARRCIG